MVEEIINGNKVINQPAGHLDNNESLTQAVIREALEETRWQVEPLYISGIYQWVHDNGETYLRFCFVCEAIKEHKDYPLDDGIEQAVWLSAEEIQQLDNLRTPLVLESLNDFVLGKKYPLSLIKDIH